MSGEDALRRLLKQDFAVIILDVKMAGLDGFETARLIRKRPRSKFTPIIFLTSHRATDLDRATGYELGAIDYLFMPVPPDVLKSKIQVFVDLAEKNQRQKCSDSSLNNSNHALKQELEHVSRLNETLRLEIASYRQAMNDGPKDGPEHLIMQHDGDYVAMLDDQGNWLYASPSYYAKFGKSVDEGA